MSLHKISIKKGREWQLLRGHPWLFSGGISQTASKATAGALVDLVDINGKFVGRGYYNPNCDIAVRILTVDSEQSIDIDFFVERIKAAAELRQRTLDTNSTNVYRLINAEGDFLPGYIVDYYAGNLVVQSHTAGGDCLLPDFLTALESVLKPQAIILRNDATARKREGLTLEQARIVSGAPSREVSVRENNLLYSVDLMYGQKTGFFSDQRDKRKLLGDYASRLPEGAVVANCFCYSGGFSVAMSAQNSNIRTVNVDESQKALALAERNLKANNMEMHNHEMVCADAFKWLESQRDQNNTFDLVILDPPAFAKAKKEREGALKGYSRLNQLGIQCVKSGGLLLTCSCSGTISLEEFRETLHEAAARHGRNLQLLEVFQNGCDHPVLLSAPETAYLKVLLCRVQ